MEKKPMYFITATPKWSMVPTFNKVATQGTEAECVDAARELVEDEVKRMCNEVVQYELSGYQQVVVRNEILITYNVRTIDPSL